MKKPRRPIIMLLAIILFGCVENDDQCNNIPETSKLNGTWLLYERGYSPGGGYITEPVPPSPAKTLTFVDNRVSSTIEGWERFKYYRILHSTLAIYANEPDGQTNIPSSDSSTFSLDLESNILTLRYQWCVEGCHLAFKKIE